MNYYEWLPIYIKITDNLGIKRNYDYISSLHLSKYINNDIKTLNKYKNKRFFIIGNGKNLKDNINVISNGIKVVADSALNTYLNFLEKPDIIVTDLDGDINLIKKSYDEGSKVILHSHGDNINKIDLYSNYFNNGIGTTQNIPFNKIYNFGGFSDGDRSAYLSDYLDASEIILIGFDFNNVNIKDYYNCNDILFKKNKLKWAKYLLKLLANRRGYNFKEKNIIEM